MKGFMVLFLLLASNLFGASNNLTLSNENDGPYINYSKDEIIVRTIAINKDGKRNTIINKYKATEKRNVPVKITFSDHPEWNFSLKLQRIIKNEPVSYNQPEKLIVLSDIEGEFDALRNILLANKVIDEQYNWIFGKGHLVICGDLFDRGSHVVETIWLLYKLEQDAQADGGYVHTILGNHDIMNMSGDLRYLKEKYIDNAKLMGIDYMELYNADAELGRWLRSKNLIEKIGDNLCLHGGIAPEINKLKLSLKEINEGSRPYYDKAKKKELFSDERIWKLFDGTKSSIFWYRGYFSNPMATDEEVKETLSLYKVKRIIIGHTIVPTNVSFYYNGKILGVAVNQHKNQHEGALYENKTWFKIGMKGLKIKLN